MQRKISYCHAARLIGLVRLTISDISGEKISSSMEQMELFAKGLPVSVVDLYEAQFKRCLR